MTKTNARKPLEADTTQLDADRLKQEAAETREKSIRARVAAGLTRAQAEEVEAQQELEDNARANR